MKIVPFPDGGDAGADPGVIAELEAALSGAESPGAHAWRELSGDVRSLAPPIDAGFEDTLRRRLSAPASSATPSTGPQLVPAPARAARRRWRGTSLAPRLLGLGGAGALAALLIAVVIVGPFAGESSRTAVPAARAPLASSQAQLQTAPAQGSSGKSASQAAAPSPAVSAPALANSTLGTSSGRVEQLAATLTLGVAPSEIQKLADSIGRVTAREGGFVASSQVQVEREQAGGATLQLSVPSNRLARTLEFLGRLASVRAESQAQQDITSPYETAKRALADAVAERSALLRALAAASTQGQIESLHRRLALAGGAIGRARSAFASISRQAANANVEVTVLGEKHLAAHELNLARGLHDAGRVLTVALAVLLIGLAGLVPLVAVVLLLGLAARVLRRMARERVLGGG